MMQLIPYPAYKDSGQPFIGKIPTHWNLFRNGRLFSQRNETGFGELPILEVSLKTGVRVRDMDNLKRKQVMSDREKYKRAAKGDIAYNMMRMWQGAVGVAPVDGLVSPAYVVVRPFPEVDCRYFSYLFRTTAYMNEVDAYSRGIVKDRNRLYWQDFKRMPSPVPPVEDQRHIARFLDAVGGKARRFIRNKRRLIDLLKEQKQNIINQAVTRGLDPNAKLKPSGVEWIGAIPEHWEVRRLKFLATKFGSGVTPRGGATVYEKHGIPFLRSQNVHFDGLKLEDVAYISKEIHAEMRGTHVLPRDVLLNITGASIGRTCSVPEIFGEANVNQHVCIIRPKINKITSGYLSKFLSVPIVQQEILFEQNGASREGLTLDAIKSIWIVIPPFTEQQDIIQHLQEKSTEIDQAITRAQREIELMREYRTRLIADVVTGQVDVRGIEVLEVAEESEADASSPLHDEDTAEADDLLDADGEVEAEE